MKKHPDTVRVGSLEFASLTCQQVTDRIFEAVEGGEGGWTVTVNIDILRQHSLQLRLRRLYSMADLVVPDGMPVVWASKLKGRPFPERVAGSDLVWTVAERAATEGRSIYLMGGEPGAAEKARSVLAESIPDLKIAGVSSPFFSCPPTEANVDAAEKELVAANPDILYVGLGAPKQDYLIAALRERLPKIWMLGVGISLSFMAGLVPRAPRWMQLYGLEFLHRLFQEPGRLARRYLLDDLPFLMVLLPHSLLSRGLS